MSGTENQNRTFLQAYSEWDKKTDAWFSLTPRLDINFWIDEDLGLDPLEWSVYRASIYPVDEGNTHTDDWVDVTGMIRYHEMVKGLTSDKYLRINL